MLGEFLGTAILILLGDGVVAGVLLKGSKGENAGWLAITAGWAFAVVAGVFTALACGSPDAHLNPAVTLGFAVMTGDFSKVVGYSLAQLAGAFLGAVAVWVHYAPALGPHIRSELQARNVLYDSRHPSARVEPGERGHRDVRAGARGRRDLFAARGGDRPAAGLGPYLIGSLVWGIGLSLGGTTGYAINPARDLGPRLAHAVLPIPGKRDSDWSYAPIPVIGPLVGGALAGGLARWIGL